MLAHLEIGALYLFNKLFIVNKLIIMKNIVLTEKQFELFLRNNLMESLSIPDGVEEGGNENVQRIIDYLKDTDITKEPEVSNIDNCDGFKYCFRFYL